jgi:hypothetical protein
MSADSLGAFQREYSAAAQGRTEVVTGGVLLLVLLGIGAFALMHTRPEQVWMGVLLIGGLAAALGVYIYAGVRKLRRRILFHADGMILHEGGSTSVVRWDEVASVRGMLPVSFRGTPTCIGGPMQIELRDGRHFRLASGYQDIEILGHSIHEKVLAHLLPQAQATLERGQAINVGCLQIDRTGIRTGDKSLAWSEYQDVSFSAEDLIIAQRGSGRPWAALKIAQTPNANLFLHLARGA